jgi:7 transmembrane receptor (Secretin family)
LGSKPDQCFNAITPNDMRSNTSCAFSGAFILFGGWAAVMWVFWRALSLHLQICWEVVPGKAFFYSALAFGWGIPAVGLALALSLTGVSFRFGNVCHINHTNGLQDFWGPLLAFAAGSLIIQAITFGYCIHVYVKSLFDDNPTTDVSSGLPSYSGSVRTRTARQAFRRVKKVIQLQWRGVMVVLVIIAEVIFFAVVFVSMDNNMMATEAEPEKARPWLLCLAGSRGDKNQCLHLAHELVEKESTILTVLVCLAVSQLIATTSSVLILSQLSGFWVLLLLGRWSMVLGWVDLVKRHFTRHHEFVSADARRLSSDKPRPYEMLNSVTSPQPGIQSPEPVAMSPKSLSVTQMSPYVDQKSDYFGREAQYTSPSTSFSSPRPPSATSGWGRDRGPTFSSLGFPKELKE